MKVIDILLEAVPGGGQIARLLLPAAARAWNAEKQAAFRQAVEALEDTLYLARSQPQPIATSQMDAYKIIQKAAPNHVADKDFAQAAFNAAEDRVTQRLGDEAAKQTAAGKAAQDAANARSADAAKSAETKAIKDREDKIRAGAGAGWKGVATQKAQFFLKWFGLGGYIAFDLVFNSYAEYYKNQEWALAQVKAGKMTVEQAKAYDASQKMLLVLNVAVTMGPVTLAVLKALVLVPLRMLKWVGKVVTGKTKQEVPIAELLSQAKWGIFKSGAWASTLALLNSDQTLPTQNWGIYDSSGAEIGKVGRALTFREVLAYFAVNQSFGKDTVSDVADDMNAWWNAVMPEFTTQKQDIEQAAGKQVTPNVVATPQKKEKIGNTTWHGDWKD